MAIETYSVKEFENYRKRFLELEQKNKNDELKCLKLESEVENLKKRNQELVGQITMIQENMGDKFVQLMIENKVLECEKRKAETELCSWKEKVKELESNMKGMNENVKEGFCGQVRKQLRFEEDGCFNKKMAPSTPCVGRALFSGVIDISDEDFKAYSLNTRSAKRKRAANIITSDADETSYDDNAPICVLKTRHSSRYKTDSDDEITQDVSKRLLTRLRKTESENRQDKSGFDLNKTVSSSEDEEGNDDVDEGSESKGESLGGFIIDTSESVSDCAPESGDSCDESEDTLREYKVALDKIGRKKVLNRYWALEGDMLADFGKDPELCMRAVCALYRQQTADEKASKETIHQNERGFSHTDAYKASKLAEFLTDGDSKGDLNKSVEELKRYDLKGVKLCMTLATKYSKQLFKIYQNKEDPYFLPQ